MPMRQINSPQISIGQVLFKGDTSITFIWWDTLDGLEMLRKLSQEHKLFSTELKSLHALNLLKLVVWSYKNVRGTQTKGLSSPGSYFSVANQMPQTGLKSNALFWCCSPVFDIQRQTTSVHEYSMQPSPTLPSAQGYSDAKMPTDISCGARGAV